MAFTGKDIGDILMAVSTLIAAISAAGISIYNTLKLSLANEERKKLGEKVEEIHVATNSMKDELVSVTSALSHSEGVAEGRAEQVKDAAAVVAAVEKKEARAAEIDVAVQAAVQNKIVAPLVPEEKAKPKK